jgi:hypothetical protein
MKKQILLLSLLILIALTVINVKTNAQSWKLTGNSGIDTTLNFLGTKDNKALIFRAKDLERMRIQPGGKIGMGTKFPSAKLNVVSPDFVTLANPGILMLGNEASSNMALDYNVIQARYNGTASSLYLNYYGGTTYVGPSSALQVAATGTTLTTGNFNFNNSTQSIQFANPSATPAPMIYMFSSGTTNTSRMVVAHSSAYPTWGLQYSDASDQFDFLGAGTSRMSINLSNGNVGIGVTAPVYKLEVCGTIRAKEVRVETGWCDYVFDKGYKLRSINELEQYINDNKHLPGIAPASEVEKNGLKVAEMNKAMMEKIEELTLYVIQLSKDNQKLQEEIDALKK